MVNCKMLRAKSTKVGDAKTDPRGHQRHIEQFGNSEVESRVADIKPGLSGSSSRPC